MDAGKKISTSHLLDPTHHLLIFPEKTKTSVPTQTGRQQQKQKLSGQLRDTDLGAAFYLCSCSSLIKKHVHEKAIGCRPSAIDRIGFLKDYDPQDFDPDTLSPVTGMIEIRCRHFNEYIHVPFVHSHETSSFGTDFLPISSDEKSETMKRIPIHRHDFDQKFVVADSYLRERFRLNHFTVTGARRFLYHPSLYLFKTVYESVRIPGKKNA